MMRLISSTAVGVAALALSLSAFAGQSESVKGKAVFAFHNPVTAANKVVVAKKGKLPQGLYGRDHCSPYDETMKPVNNGNGDGENGYYCVSKKPASVSCEVVGQKCEIEGENGLVCRAILGKCNPPGGWAGSGRSDEPQAP